MVHIKIHNKLANCVPVWCFAALSAIIVQYLPSVLKEEVAGGSHLISKQTASHLVCKTDPFWERLWSILTSFTCFINIQWFRKKWSKCSHKRKRHEFITWNVRLETHFSVCMLLLLIRHFNTAHQSFGVFLTEVTPENKETLYTLMEDRHYTNKPLLKVREKLLLAKQGRFYITHSTEMTPWMYWDVCLRWP